jgi:hypothetical protein
MAMLMPTMAAVHEQVHERAGEQDEIGQHTQEVRGMLGEEEEASDEQEADQNDLAALAHAMVMFAHMPSSSGQRPGSIGSSPRSKV